MTYWNQWNIDTREKFDEQVYPDPNTGCFFWLGRIKSTGYGMVNQSGKRILAHRAALINEGIDVSGFFVLHNCHNKLCVNPAHLRLGNHADNMADEAKRGIRKGEKHPFCIISDKDLTDIFVKRYLEKASVKSIAIDYGISEKYASALLNGKKRSHQTSMLLKKYAARKAMMGDAA